MPFSQQNRFARLDVSGVGKDELVLQKFTGEDFVNDLFCYDITAMAEKATIMPEHLLGRHAQLTLFSGPKMKRIINGIVTGASWSGYETHGHLYQLELRPWLWLCGKRRNQRIFHNKTIPQIVQEVLGDWSGASTPHLALRLQGGYEPQEYTVQYGESDLDFVRRQLERAGISFHFQHQDGGHVMILTDDPSGFDAIPGGARPFYPVSSEQDFAEEHFFEWKLSDQIETGAIRLTDYNFKTPKAAMVVEHQAESNHAWGQIESFDFPGDYTDQVRGRNVSHTRLDQHGGPGTISKVRGNVSGLAPGMLVTPTGQAGPAVKDRDFLCVGTRCTYSANSYGTGGAAGAEVTFEAEYDMVDGAKPCLPAMRTPAPRIQGPQTAMVVGKGEIDCDEYGRVLVRFHWDLDGAHSMRCRVVQHSAGGTYGGMVIPRIGMEAVVEFINGDPDKPLVTGCVFNGKTARPYALPEHKTKHVIRADSHQGEGFNEISFEAESGRENMAIHAQKDQTVRVLNNQSSNVGANRIEAVGAHATLNVGSTLTQHVGSAHTLSVGTQVGVLSDLMGNLVTAAAKFMKQNANRAGSGSGTTGYGGELGGDAAAKMERGVLEHSGKFIASAGHRDAGGAAQLATAADIAKLITELKATQGMMNTFVQRFASLSVGEAYSEQIGDAKSTTVGRVMSTSVGKLAVTRVGEDIDIEAKKSILARTVKHTLYAQEKFVIGGPGGSITIDGSGVTIKAARFVVKSASVDFMSGAPEQVAALSTGKPFAQECKG